MYRTALGALFVLAGLLMIVSPMTVAGAIAAAVSPPSKAPGVALLCLGCQYGLALSEQTAYKWNCYLFKPGTSTMQLECTSVDKVVVLAPAKIESITVTALANGVSIGTASAKGKEVAPGIYAAEVDLSGVGLLSWAKEATLTIKVIGDGWSSKIDVKTTFTKIHALPSSVDLRINDQVATATAMIVSEGETINIQPLSDVYARDGRVVASGGTIQLPPGEYIVYSPEYKVGCALSVQAKPEPPEMKVARIGGGIAILALGGILVAKGEEERRWLKL